MQDKKLELSDGGLSAQPTLIPSVERVNPSEIDTVARVLAVAYYEDPVLLWAMPRAATRLDDATLFFKYYLQRMLLPHSWDVIATADRSAIVVMRLVRQSDSTSPDGVRHLPTLVRTRSPVNDFFQWIETLRPKIDHLYLEFMVCLPSQHSKGIGSLLLGSRLAEADREGLPVWAFSSNPRNLPFYRRLGFEIGEELRRDDNTPPVTMILRRPALLRDEEESL
jgi:GNAT superfamily N-acetyltransferase